MPCQAVCINKKLAKCHTRDFTRFGESVSQRADKTSSLVRKLEAHKSCQLITCQKPLLMRGISLDCV